MPRKSTYSELNAQMGGQLPAYLSRRSKAKMSFAEVSIDLLRDYDVEVTGETIRRWIYQLGIEERRRPESVNGDAS